jgi:2-polyprenyl-6-methoxyphenol hydroxylase-like FAD-dependent oxidoreductase
MKLRDPENDISIYERNRADAAHGWGIVFWEDLLANLRDNDPQSAREILAHSFRWTDQVLDIKGEKIRGGGGGFGICRQRLLAILTNRALELGVRIHFECEVSDPAQIDADLVVASDGVGSQVRRHHTGHFNTEVVVGRNKYIWLGTKKVFKAFTFGFASTAAGWIWFHAYAFNEETSTFIVECSPETWAGLGFDALDANDSLSLLAKIFERHLDGHGLISNSCKGKRLPWLSFRNTTNHSWHTDNVVLIGDAAHTTHFSIGSGTRLAIQDAIALAKALHRQSDIRSALREYENERQRALRVPTLEAHRSALWFENVARYVHLQPVHFFRALMNRRSQLMPYVPPKLYCRLYNIRYAKGVRKLIRWTNVLTETLSARLERLMEKVALAARH